MLDQVTWSRDQMGYKYLEFSYKFQLFAPAHLPNYLRRKYLTLNFKLLFFSFLTISIPLFFWSERNYSKTFSIYVFAKFLLLLFETNLIHFQIVSLPKFPSLYIPSPYSCHWSLNSVHFPSYGLNTQKSFLLQKFRNSFSILILKNYPSLTD